MTLIVFCLTLTVFLVAGLALAWRLIGHAGRHADLDFTAGPHYARKAPDQLDRLMSQYALPLPVLEDLLTTDLFLARARSLLGGAA